MLRSLKKNPDGPLTLYIQKDSPGKEKESNCTQRFDLLGGAPVLAED